MFLFLSIFAIFGFYSLFLYYLSFHEKSTLFSKVDKKSYQSIHSSSSIILDHRQKEAVLSDFPNTLVIARRPVAVKHLPLQKK